MPDGLTGVISDGPLSRSDAAIIAGTGTPSHDMFARSRFFPGPQHGRWRCGLSTSRIVGTDSVSHVYRDGIVGEVYEFEDAAWNDAGKTITLTGAFAGLTWNDNVVVVIKSGTGWVPGIYKVQTIDSDNQITLLSPIDPDFDAVSGKWPGANNTDTTGYLCLGYYQEAYVPIGAPVGATGGGNQFNLPGVASTEFTYPVSKYWDYATCWMPPGGVGGGGRYAIRMAGRIKLADLAVHPSDSVGANAPGAYDTADGVRVCLVVDPWSSVFASLGTNHVDGPTSYRAQQRTLLGWTPAGGASESSFDDAGGGNLRLLGKSHGYLFAGDASAVRLTQFDPDGAALPDIDNGATYWVDALAGANLGNYTLFLDRSLATQVTSAVFTGSAVASVGATGSLYALRFYFDIPPRVSYLRNAEATAATDQISHQALASRAVGDSLVCVQADGSGLSANTPVTLNAVTATAATDRISEAALSSRSVGDALLCLVAGASGLTVGVTYYIKTKPTATTAELSLTPGGALFDITGDETGLSFLYSNVYYIVSKPTTTTATLSLSRGGGSVFNITSDADEVCFSYTDPDAIDTEDYSRCEIEVVIDGDCSSDNSESGVRASAVLRVLPYTETVGAVTFGASSGVGFEEFRASASRTSPGNASRDTVVLEKATGAPQVIAKADYYTDGAANGYDAYYSSRWDYGGDYDLLHLNGEVLLHALATSGEYDYPLDSIQGVQAHGLSSQGRRATKTYVHRSGESTPVAEVVFYDQARRICAVRNLDEGEALTRDDELEFRTYRYVKVQSVSGLTWDPSTRTLTGTGAFTNYTHSSGLKIALTSAIKTDPADINPANDWRVLRASTPDFTPGFYEISSKTSNNAIVLASAAGLPTYPTASTTMTFSGYFEYSSGSSWDFSPVLAQSLDTARGPRFTRGSYSAGVITVDAADLAGWTWYSGARVWITQGTGFTVPAYYTITSATSTTITISGGPGGAATNVIGQLETNVPIKADMIDRGPQFTNLAVRLAVTGPPSGDCEVEVNTYHAELIDAGSR